MKNQGTDDYLLTYEVLREKNLKSFLDAARNSGKDINVPTKTTVLCR